MEIIQNIRKVRYHLTKNYNGDCNLENIEEIESSLKIGDIKLCIESLPRLFWICKHTNDKWNIRVKIDVKFCLQYQNGHCTGDCGCLHLCKYLVISSRFCQEPCKFGFSHNINDQHNNEVWKLSSPELYTAEPYLKLKLIRNSFPRVCSDFSKDGKCPDLFCGKLHVCSKYVYGVCTDTECQLSKFNALSEIDAHNLSSHHNKAVLNSFNLSDLQSDRNILLANILLRKYLNDRKPSEIRSPVSPGKDAGIHMFQNQTHPFILCCNYLNSVCVQTLCNGLHICKEYLVNKCPKHICKFGFSHDLMDKHNCVVIQTHGLQEYPQEILLKIIQGRLPWICRNYQMKKTCNDPDCKKMHICPQFADNNSCVGNCYLSHDFKDIHNLKVLKCYLLETTDNIATNILFSRFDKTTGYTGIQNIVRHPDGKVLQKIQLNQQNPIQIEMDNQDEKIFLFMINSFPNGNCKLMHLLKFFDGDKVKAEKWFSDHLSKYRLVRNMENEITVHICLSDVMPCQFYWGKDGCNYKMCNMFHICRKLLLNRTHSSISCKYNHEITDIQKKLVTEKKLDPLTKEQLLTLLRCRYPFICVKYLDHNCQLTDRFCPNLHVCYDFMKRRCKKQDGHCDYKHVDGLNGDQALRLIKEYHLYVKTFRHCIMLPDLDKHFVDTQQITKFNSLKKDAICCQDITEKCIGVPSVESVSPHLHVDRKQYRIRITGDLYTKLEIDFKNSIRRPVTVINIEEVFNIEYVKYEAKKKTMSKKLPDVIEKSLYHGVTPETVDAVCAQNFESRICGNNGTIHGQGRYFAVNAEYSHNFTKADSCNVRYMFIADVLVGRYTLGSSIMRCPPPISLAKPHEFYDSVVDNMAKPSVFVIFEQDQFYPHYLISYKSN